MSDDDQMMQIMLEDNYEEKMSYHQLELEENYEEMHHQ